VGEGGEARCYSHFCSIDCIDEEPHRIKSSSVGVNATSNPICENGEEERQKINERKDSEYQHHYQLVLLTSVSWWIMNK
jgi:hypothetical protein